ncbi:MAG: hypothetical protein HQK62_08405 [Desulfamplus sp.]|nr:hypothetical protein [Desulfamplus sp.]
MKVTDPDVIKAGERDLIESIKDDLDFSAVQAILLKKIRSYLKEIEDGAISFDVSGGEIFVHGGQVAFKIDFQLKTEMSIVFDRNGDYIPDSYIETGDGLDSHDIFDNKEDEITDDELRSDNFHDESEDPDDELKEIDEQVGDDDLLDELQPNDLSDDLASDQVYDEPEEQAIEDQYIMDELESDGNPDLQEEDKVTDALLNNDLHKEDMESVKDEKQAFNPDDQLQTDELLIDDIDPFEEDILGDIEGDDVQQTSELDPIADLKELNQSDDIEELLKESRNFWESQEK